MAHLPRYDSEWGRCETCGRSFPSSHLILSKFSGWQCLPGLWGNGCWEGPIQRFELRFVPPPEEGTRHLPAAPYALETLGVDASDSPRIQIWKDQETSQVYKVTFGTSILFEEQDGINGIGGLKLNPPYSTWIANGSMQFGSIPPMTVPRYAVVPPWISLYVEDGSLIYNAPDE